MVVILLLSIGEPSRHAEDLVWRQSQKQGHVVVLG
jgi:hypothetical protein